MAKKRRAARAKTPEAAPAPPAAAVPDAAERALIVEALDTNMLVEAAAGTGKTTSMVARMVELVAQGRCEVERLAAVTFTRKAAGELRSRFQVALERGAREADGPRRARLARAAGAAARCFIGTIHSFCARLLRERPVEAGVDVAFREIDEDEDARMRAAAWEEYVARLYARGDPALDELTALGVDVRALEGTFVRFATYPDVEEWPAESPEAPDVAGAAGALEQYVAHIAALAPSLPEDPGYDRLMPRLARVARRARHADLAAAADVAEVLEDCRPLPQKAVVQKNWPGGKEQAKAEEGRWQEFAAGVATPFVTAWRQRRYGAVLAALAPAREIYDRMRRAAGALNYQDLLLRAAGLLRARAHVRAYFRERITHLLVDEFQDTDPVQAEVMLLLTADDPAEEDWRRCRPAPGALFVVGDPKQSIYRFRRADIVTYHRVRAIIEKTGGRVVTLSANFRTAAPIVAWVNRVFAGAFPAAPTDVSPAYVPLRPAREDPGTPAAGVEVIQVPPESSENKRDAAEYDAALVARTIRAALDEGTALPRTAREAARGVRPEARPGDFMVVTRTKAQLSVYARHLQELGIPHRVTGGSALNEVEELSLLARALRAAARPDDAVALVAALRSELFGISDAALYAFRRAGGRFDVRTDVPAELPAESRDAIADAWARIRTYAGWLDAMPAAAAAERAAADLGLFARAAAAAGGDVRAGSLGKAVELLRAAQEEIHTAAGIVDYLGALAEGREAHDGLSARAEHEDVVRVMNLHQVKGLEAPVVFLADPSGAASHEPEIHVDRSGASVRGYLAVLGPKVGWQAPVLATPVGWETLAAREREFLDAEEVRLLYVAATRAGSRLVITQRAKRNGENPWAFFLAHLADAPACGDPGSRRAPPRAAVRVHAADAAAAAGQIDARWALATTPGYEVRAAKAAAVEPSAPASAAGEHGTEWGTVVHVLLEALMRNPAAGLEGLARSVVADEGLEPVWAAEAVATARAVTASEIWARARAAATRLVEVPFVAPAADAGAVTRGVIDLAFREAGGWVIVDYKTDRADVAPATLAGRYLPQVRAYAEAWGRITGEPVRERGLYFTHLDAYVAERGG